MNIETFSIAMVALFSWGIGSFVAKIATNRIGEKSLFFDTIFYGIVLIIYSLLVFKSKNLFSGDKTGMVLAALAGIIGSAGAIAFYILITKKDASVAVPLTALYPALTAILSFIFLGEQLTLVKAIAIIMASISLYLLSL